MMEFMNERERYLKNPLRLIRSMADLAMIGVRMVDDNLAEFTDDRPFNETNYPPVTLFEAPVATEEELA